MSKLLLPGLLASPFHAVEGFRYRSICEAYDEQAISSTKKASCFGAGKGGPYNELDVVAQWIA